MLVTFIWSWLVAAALLAVGYGVCFKDIGWLEDALGFGVMLFGASLLVETVVASGKALRRK